MIQTANEIQTINTAWQIAMQEIMRMVIRDMYHSGGEAAFNGHIKRIEEAAVDSIHTDLRLRGTDEWTEVLVKERASNFVTTLLTSFTYDRAWWSLVVSAINARGVFGKMSPYTVAIGGLGVSATERTPSNCGEHVCSTPSQNPDEGMKMIDLTTTQIQGLKLAKNGDLFPLDGKKWTHLNAQVTYAKHDRFKERPQKVKSLTTVTLKALRDHGLIKSIDAVQIDQSAHAITMAGKMWLSLYR
jgi:hypothetical protein